MSHATKQMEVSNIADILRLPCLSNAPQIKWVYSTSIGKLSEKFGDRSLFGLMARLLPMLPTISTGPNRTATEKQVILACQAFAAKTVFSAANIYHLKSNIWQQLNFFNPSAGIEFIDILQIGMEIISEPYKKEHPLHLYHGCDIQHSAKADQNLAVPDFQAGLHPLQLWIKRKFLLLLIDRIRQYDGAKDFKRTNAGLLKRTSQAKMREAVNRMGITQISEMLILHQVLCAAIASKEFYSPSPQVQDHENLHRLYQVALLDKHYPTCSLSITQDRLLQLGSCLRSYSNSRVTSLNIVSDNGSELLDSFACTKGDRFNDHHYSNPLDYYLKLELQEQTEELKMQVHEQLRQLPSMQMQSFYLKAQGQNDSQIAKIQSSCASSTVKRRRDRVISQATNISVNSEHFAAVAKAYLEISKEYFET
jgi:hypothetical protein